MKLRVTYDDGTPIRIKRPPTLTDKYVAFLMHGSTAVWKEGDDTDLPEIVEAVEELDFVQAVSMGENE